MIELSVGASTLDAAASCRARLRRAWILSSSAGSIRMTLTSFDSQIGIRPNATPSGRDAADSKYRGATRPALASISTDKIFHASSSDIPDSRSQTNRLLTRSCDSMRIRPDTTLWYHFDHSLGREKGDIHNGR